MAGRRGADRPGRRGTGVAPVVRLVPVPVDLVNVMSIGRDDDILLFLHLGARSGLDGQESYSRVHAPEVLCPLCVVCAHANTRKSS